MSDLVVVTVQPVLKHHQLDCKAHVRVAYAPTIAHTQQTVLLRYVVQIHIVSHAYRDRPWHPLLAVYKYFAFLNIYCMMDKVDRFLEYTFNILMCSIFQEVI